MKRSPPRSNFGADSAASVDVPGYFKPRCDSAALTTLHAYLAADCSVQAVAERLYIHRNTVRYRLDQIERLTGRSLQSTQDRVQLWLALLAASPSS